MSTKHLLEEKSSYKSLQVNLVFGTIGVLVVLILLAAQYGEYTRRLGNLSAISRTASLPIQLAVNTEMMEKEKMKWLLHAGGEMTLSFLMIMILKGNSYPVYIQSLGSFHSEIMAAENVSQLVFSVFQ